MRGVGAPGVFGAGLWLVHAEPTPLLPEKGAGDLATDDPGVPKRDEPMALEPYAVPVLLQPLGAGDGGAGDEVVREWAGEPGM
jgi:hypothetical protein